MRSLTAPIAAGEDSVRARQLFDRQWHENARRTDRMFAVLMILQWAGAVIVACWLSPRTWNGSESHVHPHVWLAVFLGGALASLPVYLAWLMPGHALTRYVIAVAQVMFSSLLIHVSGGRIETHFHVFGSLAFLAFYRDWKVLVPATLFVAVDHFVRGTWWPETVFGIASPAPWRWLEHAGWVLFEDVFLAISCVHGVREMWSGAVRTAELERINCDIQKQSAELETSYRAKHAIVETALDAVIGMDRNGRITEWNSRAEATFGWTAEEVMGKSLAETIIPEKDRPAHREGLQRYLATGVSGILNRRIEIAAVHRSRGEFPVEVAIAPIRSADSISFCAYVRDITARLQHANDLHAAKESAESANRAKSAFLANMSHEIRTPLNAILGFADLLLHQIDGDVEERRDYLHTIHDSGRHLLTLIDDVLDLSKIESGQMDVERVRCSPHDIIAASISILRVRAEERGLLLEYFWKSDAPETICSDPARLRQILMNLIGNAIKFTEIGSVQVAARLIQDESPRLVVDVIDTGIGIEPAGMERIFDPFVQADTSITRRFGGTGLGLSISRRLAQMLGGDLRVASESGRGSIFSLSIPTGPLDNVPLSPSSTSDVVAAPPALRSGQPHVLAPCKILLVEDGVTNRKLFSLILERAGAKTRCAENGRAGVDIAAAESFDLILMDMQMPVMDGYRATRELRRLGCTAPIIALTAHAMEGDEQKCRDAGCTGFLTKPINQHRLLATVAKALAATTPNEDTAIALDANQPRMTSTLPLDDADFREIVEEFIARLEEKIGVLNTAWEERNIPLIGEIAHWIKGAGGTAGFDALTAPAAELETAVKHGPCDRIARQIQKIEEVSRRIYSPAAI